MVNKMLIDKQKNDLIFFSVYGTFILIYICYLESPNVQVDAEGKKVRPAHTRCSTVILREIPSDTQLQEIKVIIAVTNFVRLPVQGMSIQKECN